MGLADAWRCATEPRTRPAATTVGSALVRGSDSFGHFHTEQHVCADRSEAALAHLAEDDRAAPRIL